MVLLNIYKPMQNEWETQSLVEKNRFEIKNETEDQSQSIPKSTGTLTVARSWLESVLTNGADKPKSSNGVHFDFEVKFDLEGQERSPQKQ